MTTIIISGLANNKYITQGYGAAPSVDTTVSGPLATIRRRKKILWFKVRQFLEAEASE